MSQFRGTTICAVKRDGVIAIAGDGQVTMGESVIMKNGAKKVRRIFDGKVVIGFAGAVADAFALSEKLEAKLSQFSGNLQRAAVELAQDWRTNKEMRQLQAMLIAAGLLKREMEEEKSKLILTIFVREIVSPDEINLSNQINITGYVCKQPIYRTTPFGREITDMLIAVNRSYNKSDYLPCIAWGRNARFTGDLNVGEKIELIGRIQSRKYSKKVNETETIIKTAYEISISSVILIDDRNIKNDNYNLTNKNVYSEYRNIENISIIQ